MCTFSDLRATNPGASRAAVEILAHAIDEDEGLLAEWLKDPSKPFPIERLPAADDITARGGSSVRGTA